jgi:hypothetical protein
LPPTGKWDPQEARDRRPAKAKNYVGRPLPRKPRRKASKAEVAPQEESQEPKSEPEMD